MSDIDLDRLQALHEKERNTLHNYLTDAESKELRNALPSLLAELRELRAEREKTQAFLAECSKTTLGKVVDGLDAALLKERDSLRHEQACISEILDKWFDDGDERMKLHPVTKATEVRGMTLREIEKLAFSLVTHIERQREWSLRTFGPGARTNGVLDHIAKELGEIRQNPSDLEEWVDVILLAIDGAHRSGASPEQIVDAIRAKLAKNMARQWPDRQTQDPNKAIEHDRRGGAR